MPHFFFDIHNVEIQASDDEGSELPDLEAARRKAIEGIRSILSHEVLADKLDLRGQINVRDEDGVIRFSVGYGQAVDIRRPE